MAAWRKPAKDFEAPYDLWLAQQSGARIRGLRIVSPLNGDTFVLNPTDDPVGRASQQIQLRALSNGRTLRWSAGSKTLASGNDGTSFWPLQLGTWTIAASDGTNRDSVRIRVIAPPRRARPGFTFSRPR